jgi:heme-degrading monooxygenase HmoA
MVRQGYKQKKLLEMPGFSGFQVVRKIDEASK